MAPLSLSERFGSNNRRGFVLIAVLALSALIVAIALEVAYITRVEGERAARTRGRAAATLAAWSGTRLALAVLAADDASIDGPGDLWTTPISWSDDLGAVTVTITDESGGLPIQGLFTSQGLLDLDVKARLDRLIAALDLPPFLSDRLVDYCDANDEPFPLGAESADYGALTPPRRPANRMLRTRDELSQVSGFTDTFARLLSPAITLWGGPLVNINTASPAVIAGLISGLSVTDAERITTRREWGRFTAVQQVGDIVGLSPEAMGELKKSSDVASQVFRIESRGEAGGVDVVLTSIVERQSAGFVVKYRKLE